jgi:hypothetical protein
MMNRKGKQVSSGLIWIVAIALIAIVGLGSYAMFWNPVANEGLPSPSPGAPNAGATQCSQNPAYTYSATDKYSTSAVTGTDEIKIGSLKPVTSLANPTFGEQVSYWKDNTSGTAYFCEVTPVKSVYCGAQQLQTTCYQNGTLTLSVYDTAARASLSSAGGDVAGNTNVTIGANGQANFEVGYQGTAKKANMPFGGCMVVEVPSTITTVSPSGMGISAAACPYTLTYAVSSTSNVYKAFAVPAGFDADGAGDFKKINLQLQAGASNPSGYATVTFYPANNYITNTGEIKLGIEKDANADTTKTFASGGGLFKFGII